VCTLLQSRKVLVCVVWTTSNALRSHWMRHRPTAAAGRLHTITSRELGPVAHARPPSMAYAPLSPYDRPLPCHQTRPANSNSTLLSSASDRRSARRFIALLRPTPLFYYYQIRTLCLLSPLAPSHHYVTCMHFGALYPAFTAFGFPTVPASNSRISISITTTTPSQ
jgi:hypothetical protein